VHATTLSLRVDLREKSPAADRDDSADYRTCGPGPNAQTPSELLNARCHCLDTHPGAQLLAIAVCGLDTATIIDNNQMQPSARPFQFDRNT
jgi:hypothetical protein